MCAELWPARHPVWHPCSRWSDEHWRDLKYFNILDLNMLIIWIICIILQTSIYCNIWSFNSFQTLVSDTPLEFIVEYLLKAKEIADSNASVPEELRCNLQKALDIASGLDMYLERMSSPESEPFAELFKWVCRFYRHSTPPDTGLIDEIGRSALMVRVVRWVCIVRVRGDI